MEANPIEVMSMLQIYWNREELEKKISRKDSPAIYFDLEIHFIVNGADIAGGATTNCRFFFTQHYGALQFLFPETLGDKDLHIVPRDNNVVGEGFDNYLTLQPGSDRLSIRYWGSEPGNVYHTIEVPLQQFVKAVVVANERLLREAAEIWPKVAQDNNYIELQEEIAIVKEWYRDRFGSVL